MNLIDLIHQRAAQNKKHLVFPEGQDERMLFAAEKLVKQGICQVTLLGTKDSIRRMARSKKIDLDQVRIINPADSDLINQYSEQFYQIRKHKKITIDQARRLVFQPLYFGAMMIREEEVDGSVAGAVNTTGNVLKAAIHCLGLAENISVVSSTFLMVIPGWDRPLSYADAGVVPDPNSDQLASIAISSAKTHQKITGDEPYIAMLSFSTYGSASHRMVDKVKEATRLVKERAPELKVDGELQADAALIPQIGASKAPGSLVAGKANVLILPDLNAGNISYKLTERLANAMALGPLIQGLKKPAMDLSRGCSVEDIINVAAICCVLSV